MVSDKATLSGTKKKTSALLFAVCSCLVFIGYVLMTNGTKADHRPTLISSNSNNNNNYAYSTILQDKGGGGWDGRNATMDSYLVDTVRCRIRKYDAYDPTVTNFIQQTVPKVKCDKYDRLTYTVEDVLYGSDALSRYTCCYTAVHRDEQSQHPDNTVTLNKKCRVIEFPTKLTDEFVEVKCHTRNGTVSYLNYHAVIVVPDRQRPSDHSRNATTAHQQHYNVLVLGMDSTSRLNFHRHMTRTDSLLRSFDAIELFGYNKVGSNTLPNVVAMMTGSSVNELKNGCARNKTWDECRFVWSDYHDAGFATMYVEDNPFISTFNYLQKGFVNKPTDHYPRALLMRAEDRLGYNKPLNCKLCIGGMTQAELVLNYVADYVNGYHRLSTSTAADDAYGSDGGRRNTFGLAWVNSLTHDFLNWPKIADGYFANFLRNISQSGALDKTILFFVSDHGLRWGKIVSTEIGRYEERLPFAFVVLPQSFKDNHPDKVENLRLNSHRLTTPYDVHSTLRHILDLGYDGNSVGDDAGGGSGAIKGQGPGDSLLNEIGASRTCNEAGVADTWCSCTRRITVDRTNGLHWRIVHDSSILVLRTINALISSSSPSHSLCHHLILDRVITAHWLLPTYKKEDEAACGDGSAVCDLSLVLSTSPGGAEYEATVVRRGWNRRYRQPTVDGIVRLNLYNETSSCVHDRILKDICYCIHQS